MALSSIEKCGIRLCNNNFLDDASVTIAAETDYNGNTVADILDTRDFGVYRLTKDPVQDAFIFDVTLPNSLEPTVFAILPANYNEFYLTAESEVTVEASNFGFNAIQKTFTGRFSRFGVQVNFTENSVQNSYRYFRIKITTGNRTNFDETLDIKYFYFGDHVGLTTRNIATGFGVALNDLSESFVAESGREYFNEKDLQLSISGLTFQFMGDSDRANFQKFYYHVRKSKNFLTILDPDDKIEAEYMELMRMMRFVNLPNQSHRLRDLFETSFELREAI
jgi:hypothetical protein